MVMLDWTRVQVLGPQGMRKSYSLASNGCRGAQREDLRAQDWTSQRTSLLRVRLNTALAWSHGAECAHDSV